MAAAQPTSPESFLLDLLRPDRVRHHARRLGFVLRIGPIKLLPFVLAVVLTPSGRGEQPIAAMRRAFERRTGYLPARSSFWERLSPAFGRLVRWMLDDVVDRSWDATPKPPGFLSSFKDVIAGDATVVQVHDSLAGRWKGTATPAAIKVHTLVRALTGELLRYRITAETRPECRVFGVGHWARNVLFLLDRGYADGSLWWRIDRLGGSFVTRLKTSFHARVVSVNPGHRGSRSKPIGKKAMDLAAGRSGGRIDVMCSFAVRVRPYRSARGRRFPHVFRVVGVWNRTHERYHFYVTNVGVDRFTAEQVEVAYRLRWEVERFYVAAKSGMGLDRITSRKPHIVEALIRAALLRCTVAMQAKRQAERTLPTGRWINALAWIKVWRERIGDLLGAWLDGVRRPQRVSWERLAWLAVDPSRRRLSARVAATLGAAVGWGYVQRKRS